MGHLPQLCRRRAVHFVAEGDADKLLHIRLRLLH